MDIVSRKCEQRMREMARDKDRNKKQNEANDTMGSSSHFNYQSGGGGGVGM